MNSHLNAEAYGPAPKASIAEIAGRVRRLRLEMEQASVDLMVLTSKANIQYFSGWPNGGDRTRPSLLLVGRSGVGLVAPRMYESLIEPMGLQCDAHLYSGFVPQWTEMAVATSQSMVGNAAKIGLDYGQDHAGAGSLPLIDGLSRNADVVEAGNIIWNVRVIKSDFELRLIRASLDLANRAFDNVLPLLKPGVTELSVYQELQFDLIRNGADKIEPFPVIFGRNAFAYGRRPTDRRLEIGDYIWTDFYHSYGGYGADRNRTARMGAPSAAERDAYTAVRHVTHEVCRGIRAGSTCGDAYALFETLWKSAGLTKLFGAGRIGHGGGLDFTEPPSIAPTSAEVIKPGMVLHVEPKLETDHGVFQFEEVICVGADQNQFLSVLSPAELPVVGS
ncbi:Xaa-Pro peptidase family protein [Bradyrhizobium sp. CB1650]|uniref:M24 family metallopeptidase n=1 Tax=Bradyrhizobium sp. CB1650 TaxID=3039153 RepID=UPI002435EB3A|nr:Xaa-Pro peptidase family protein [Bradyrhizobium sp. CB1650]WGD51122.1 Xaa-Pro peptidase family protein [Bradyrhizobium sp. CB1650]